MGIIENVATSDLQTFVFRRVGNSNFLFKISLFKYHLEGKIFFKFLTYFKNLKTTQSLIIKVYL